MQRKRSYDKSVYQSLALVFQFGINMLVPIVLMLFLGIALDQHFQTGWISVVFFFAGAAAGFTNIYKMTRGVMKSSRERTEEIPEKTNEELSKEIKDALSRELERNNDGKN